jgi:signal transduction histidine kinase
VNERGLARAEDSIERSASSLRRTLLITFGITLAGGLLLTLLTIGHTMRLERELERRLAENTRARSDLEDLSARLVRAQENERRTLARELHDEVGQSLSAILMETENAETTVETHRTHILQKLDLHSVPELILYAVRKGIIS